MSPVKGLSEIRHMSRLGKIRLGIKVEKPGKQPYPAATDFFVVPDELKKYVGEKPNVLNIMLPTDNPEDFAPQYLKCYSLTQGLVCKGDGVRCRRKVDTDTGAAAGKTTERWEYKEMTCDPESCPEMVGDEEHHIRPHCRKVMNLMFVLPEVPGLGVWQLDTSSFHSIVNVNSFVEVFMRLTRSERYTNGRIAGIPLKLALEPRDVSPEGIKKKTVHVLRLHSDLRWVDLQRRALPAPPSTAVAKPEEEEPPDDLFPTEVLAQQEGVSPPTPAPEAPPPRALPQKAPVKPKAEWDKVTQDMVPDYPHLLPILWDLGRVQPEALYQTYGVNHHSKMPVSAWEAFVTLKDRLGPVEKTAQQKLV